MARKTLLTEAEVRQFMKLANLGALSSRKLDEMGYYTNDLEEQEEEEDLEVDMGPVDELPPVDDEVDAIDDLEAGPGEGEAVGEADVEELVQALADTIQQVTGVEVSVEGSEEGVEDIGLGDEEVVDDLEVDAEIGGEDIPIGAEEEEEIPVPGMRNTYNESEIVNEVARRVVERLAASQRQEAIADALAERILKRITSTK
jgi:hypothetical protein